MSGGNYMFMMVGKDDIPIYEAEFRKDLPNSSSQGAKKDDNSHLNQFIIHAAMDMVDEQVWNTQTMYFKNVDKFNDFLVSAYVTSGCVKFMLLHDVNNNEGIRNFFQDVHELYVKVLANPFYEVNTPITSPLFHSRVTTLGRRYF